MRSGGAERRPARYPGCVSDVPKPPPDPADVARARDVVRMGGGLYALVTLFALGLALFSGHIKTLFGEQGVPGLAPTFGGLAVGLALVGLSRIALHAWAGMERAAAAMADLLGPLTWRQALVLALASAVGEELLFRGALWSLVDHPLWTTTCLFGLVHVLPRKELWGYPLFALVAGLLLGLLRDGTGSVLPPMLAHAAVNALNLAWLGRHHARLVAMRRTDALHAAE